MKKEIIDNYEVYSEDGEFKKVIFRNHEGKEVCVSVEKCLKIEFLERRREEYSEQHKIRKHIDIYVNDGGLLELKTSKLVSSAEDMVIAEDEKNRIIKEIWKLPTPQNRRVYMHIVDEFSLTEIAKIENRDLAAIKRSTEVRLK